MHFEFFSKVRIYRQCQRTLKKKCRFLELSDQIRSKMYSCYRVCVIYRAIHIAGYAFFLKCCHLHMNHESPKNFILLLSIFYACEINNKYYVDWSYVTELYIMYIYRRIYFKIRNKPYHREPKASVIFSSTKGSLLQVHGLGA